MKSAYPFKFPAYRLDCGVVVQPIHWSDDPAHDEAWADRTAAQYGGRQSSGWMREYEMKPVAGGQPVWPMMTRSVHVEQRRFADILGPGWTRFRVLDHGIRHPTCCAWVAVNPRGDRYFYRQYYAAGRTIAENCLRILRMTEAGEEIAGTFADPAIWSRNPVTGQAFAEVYRENGLELEKADNRGAGYDTVATGLVSSLAEWSLFHGEVHAVFGKGVDDAILESLREKPGLWFHPCCADGVQSLYEECANLRWQDVRGDPFQHALPQKPVDVNDEGADVVRYAMHTSEVYYSLPEPKMPETLGALIRRRAEARAHA